MISAKSELFVIYVWISNLINNNETLLFIFVDFSMMQLSMMFPFVKYRLILCNLITFEMIYRTKNGRSGQLGLSFVFAYLIMNTMIEFRK